MALLPSAHVSNTPSGHLAPSTGGDGDVPQALFGDLLAQVLALMLGTWPSTSDGSPSTESSPGNGAAPIAVSVAAAAGPHPGPLLSEAGLLAHGTGPPAPQGSLPLLDGRAVSALDQGHPQDEGGQWPASVGEKSSGPGHGPEAGDLPPLAHVGRGMTSPPARLAVDAGPAAGTIEMAAPGQSSSGQELPPSFSLSGPPDNSASNSTQERPASGVPSTAGGPRAPSGTRLTHTSTEVPSPAPVDGGRESPGSVSPPGKAEGGIAAGHGMAHHGRVPEALLPDGHGAYEAPGGAADHSPSWGLEGGPAPPAASQAAGPSQGAVPSEAPVVESALPDVSRPDPDVVDQVLRHARLALRPGRSELSVHLEPPSLGKVDVHLVLDGHGLTLHLGAETHRAKDLIEANLAGLRAGLAEQGLKVERVVVDLNSPGAAAAWADPGRQQPHSGQQPGRWDGPRLPPPADSLVNDAPKTLAPTEPYRDHQVDYWA